MSKHRIEYNRQTPQKSTCHLIHIEALAPAGSLSEVLAHIHEALPTIQQYGAAEIVKLEVVEHTFDQAADILILHRKVST